MGRANRRRTTEEEAKPPGRGAGSAWWLSARYGGDGTSVLTIDSGGEEALAVFSFEEEADLFLHLGALGADWRIEPAAGGELFSEFLGSRARIGRVALDPCPEVGGRRMVDLVCVSRERFVHTYGPGFRVGDDARLQALP